jgi:arsenate reductase
LTPSQLIRRNETDFKHLQLDATMVTEQQLLDAMVMHPALIERPIVVFGDKAVIGRPPENVLGLL